MPKIKTRRGAAKRFKVTGSGKVVHRRSGRNHILTNKSRKRKRQLKNDPVLDSVDEKRVKLQIPYL